MTNQMLSEELTKIGQANNFDLGHLSGHSAQDVEVTYYPQFDVSIRFEAEVMAKHYAVFYALEKSIRALVSQVLEGSEQTEDWWIGNKVPDSIKQEVKSRISKELDAGVTRRSLDELDYTTFGELSTLITYNWAIFGGMFTSRKAVEKIFASLNALRNPIAHCTPLAEDEVVRLQLTVRDWFRLME